jgi:hypothetical protein
LLRLGRATDIAVVSKAKQLDDGVYSGHRCSTRFCRMVNLISGRCFTAFAKMQSIKGIARRGRTPGSSNRQMGAFERARQLDHIRRNPRASCRT